MRRKIAKIQKRLQGAINAYGRHSPHSASPKHPELTSKSVIEKVLLLKDYLLDSRTPLKYKALAVGALLYFINPFDAIPDITPLIGFADDVALVLWTARKLNAELSHYTPEPNPSEE